MQWFVFHSFLRPLILSNYWLRSHGWLPDKWFWADAVAVSWGYFA